MPVPPNSQVAQDAGKPYSLNGHTRDGAIAWSASLSPILSPTRRVSSHPPPSVNDTASQASESHYEEEIESWRAPELLEVINRNGLVVFLLVSPWPILLMRWELLTDDCWRKANVLTGVVNLSMHTMYATSTIALGVLILYSFVVCGFAWVCRYRRLWRQ